MYTLTIVVFDAISGNSIVLSSTAFEDNINNQVETLRNVYPNNTITVRKEGKKIGFYGFDGKFIIESDN